MLQYIPEVIKPYIGKSIVNIQRVSDSAFDIAFNDESVVQLGVEGDCCSHSIFYELVCPFECKGAEIIAIEDGCSEGADTEEVALKKIVDSKINFYPEENSIWDVVFKTTAGDIRFRHANSSNGYYNGCTTFRQIS